MVRTYWLDHDVTTMATARTFAGSTIMKPSTVRQSLSGWIHHIVWKRQISGRPLTTTTQHLPLDSGRSVCCRHDDSDGSRGQYTKPHSALLSSSTVPFSVRKKDMDRDSNHRQLARLQTQSLALQRLQVASRRFSSCATISSSSLLGASLSSKWPFQGSTIRPTTMSSSSSSSIQRLSYHSSSRSEIFMYTTLIIAITLGYVVFRKSRGEPLTPEHLTQAKAEFKRLEQDRMERNKKSQQKKIPSISKDESNAETKPDKN